MPNFFHKICRNNDTFSADSILATILMVIMLFKRLQLFTDNSIVSPKLFN